MNNQNSSTVTFVELTDKEMFHLLNQPDVILANEEIEIQKLGNEPVQTVEQIHD